MGVTVKYKGNTIASMNTDGTKTLKTSGKYCEGDIGVEYTVPTSTLISKNILANGTYTAASDNADGYSSVIVNVPGIVPSGTLNITTNGTYDVTDKAQAVVAISAPTTNSKCFVVTINSDQSGKQVVLNSDGDSEIGNHRNDSTFCIGVIAAQDTSVSSTRSIFVGNNLLHSNAAAYGYYLRSSTSGLAYSTVTKKPSDPQQSTAGTLSVDANGVISVFASSTYPIKAGSYIVICGW